MQVPFLDLKRQYAPLREEINAEIQWVLDNTAFILGPKAKAFEERFATLHNAKHCIAANSGTSAIHLALLAHGVGPGDEVVVPAMTFIATAWPVSYCGATPVFCDVRQDTGTLDPACLERAITPRTKAVLPVHLYGQPCDLAEIGDICKSRDLVMIEDCAQAHAAEYQGRRVGTFGAAGCFSFYPGKNLGAYGEGGAVVTNDDALAQTMRILRDQGQSQRYHHDMVGYNYRMEGIQAAVLGVKLKYIEEWNEQRRNAVRCYREGLKGVTLPGQEKDRLHSCHLFVVRHKDRDRLLQEFKEKGIDCGLHYPRPLHLQQAYAGLGHAKGDFPQAEGWADQCLSLPLFPEITEAEISHVVQTCGELAG